MASGNWGALTAFGGQPGAATKRIYGIKGNSFIAAVEFGPRVKAKSLLAGGQSGDPAYPISPIRRNATQPASSKTWPSTAKTWSEAHNAVITPASERPPALPGLLLQC